MTDTELLSTPQAAKILGKSVRTIHRMVETGELTPALTAPGGPNGAYLFHPRDIAKLGVSDATPTRDPN